MNEKSKKEIKDLIIDIKTKCNFQPNEFMDLGKTKKMIDRLGGVISPYFGTHHEYNVEGKIFKSGIYDFIFLTYFQECVYTLSYMLGLLFIGMGFKIDKGFWDKQDGLIIYNFKTPYDIRHRKAQEFAMEFMLPADRYKKVLKDYEFGIFYDVNKIRFYIPDISDDILIYRGKQLNIFNRK